MSPFLSKRNCEPLRTDSARDPCNIFGMMNKKKNRIEIAKKIISSVKKEMQKPRLTESVRNDARDHAAAPVAEKPPARSERV